MSLLSLLVQSFYHKESWKSETWIAMDTFFEFHVPSVNFNKDLKLEISSLLEELDLCLNVYREGSEIQKLNFLASKQTVKTSAMLFGAITKALWLSELSSGIFDPTFEPLQDAYGFKDGRLRIPEKDELNRVLEKIGWGKIILDAKTQHIQFTNDQVKLNLSALIKGLALDEIAAYMDSKNIDEYVLNFGGSLKIKKNTSLTLLIQDPRSPKPAGQTKLSSGSISTSSDGQQFFEREGLRYSHIINPLTGSAQNPLRSVSIYHPDSALLADMLSTSLLLMEKSEALAFLSQHFPEAGMLGIDTQGKFSWNMEWMP
jgi:thiamine biosynthesis lipoprotein